MTDNRSYYDPNGYGKQLDSVDIDRDGKISYVEGSLIGMQYFIRQAEIENMPCIKSKLHVDFCFTYRQMMKRGKFY